MEAGREETVWREITGQEGKLCLELPDNLKKMTEEMAWRRFPYSQRPQEMFSDPDGDRIFTYSILEKQLREGQVYSAAAGIQKLISHAYPESIREQARTVRLRFGMAGWFSFFTGGMKEDSCHYMFVLPADERMVFGGYHFPAKEETTERKVFLRILKSIWLIGKDMENGEADDGRGRIQ